MENLYVEVIKLRQENTRLEKENKDLKKHVKYLENSLSYEKNNIKQLKAKIERMEKETEDKIAKAVESQVNKIVSKVVNDLNKKHQEEISNLTNEISRLKKNLGVDSTNSSIPTSHNPIGKHSNQNNREKSDKSIGGQVGHSVHKLDYFNDDEITDIIHHTLDQCPDCGYNLNETHTVKSDIIDLVITVTKTRNIIHNYKCPHCKKRFSANDDLPRGVSYGSIVNGIALNMMNEANTSLNKVTSFFKGVTNNAINLSESYLAKLQRKSAQKLGKFIYELTEAIKKLKYSFWDDTVVTYGLGKPCEDYDGKDLEYIAKDENKNKKVRNGIIRFYGDDCLALLIGHRFKNKDGIDEDGILSSLGKDCVVMHDHVLLNYNNKYQFQNAECNEHIRRYLKGNLDIFPDHEWAKKMRDFLAELNSMKKELIAGGSFSFSDSELKEFYDKYDSIIKLGYQENKTVDIQYVDNKKNELNLIERLDKFRENHLLFIKDFNVEFTNNTSERGLRQVKRKIAVSFMFKNANRMKDYAIILSYLETAFRNGFTRFEACKTLAENRPFTIDELLKGNA